MASPQPVTLATLTGLLSNHHAKLSSLYGLLSPAPQPLVEAHLLPLQTMLASTIDQQLAAAEYEVSSAEERLALGWKRVHEWQTALGEPLRAEKKRGDGPLVSLVEDVDRIKESMKSRMQKRGQRILELQRRLGALAEVVGREWLEISLDEAAQDDDRWEDLDLTQNRMTALEREIVRCESEIVSGVARDRPRFPWPELTLGYSVGSPERTPRFGRERDFCPPVRTGPLPRDDKLCMRIDLDRPGRRRDPVAPRNRRVEAGQEGDAPDS